MTNIIPKTINYCWFGGKDLPELAQKCINSWKKYCPDYKIVRWDESNFDINCCSYVKEAYQEKKWAFVSDYARFEILYKYGGIYFDTDVELIKPIDDIIAQGSFMGTEKGAPLNKSALEMINKLMPELSVSDNENSNNIHKSSNSSPTDTNGTNLLYAGTFVNPGLGIAAIPGLQLYKEILDYYKKTHFINADGSLNEVTVVMYTTGYLSRYGLTQPVTMVQRVANINIYPSEYFCPMNYETGEINVTKNTRSIHHYSETWHSPNEKKWHSFEKKINRNFGVTRGYKLLNSFPIKLIRTIYINGWKDTIHKIKGSILGKK